MKTYSLPLQKASSLRGSAFGIVWCTIMMIVGAMSLQFVGCSRSAVSGAASDAVSVTVSSDVPAVYKLMYGATSITRDGDFIVIKSNGRPDHKSPYYQGTQWAGTLYEAYNGSNRLWNQNPNSIGNQNYTFRIPMNPTEAATKTATPLGPMGVSINGVPLYNQYAAGRSPLTGEINSFDQYGGHPAQGSDYHYHVEPTALTASKGKSALLGFLLDGFPVYGPMENGTLVQESALDAYHGHKHATAEYPNGIYHYHITATDPYINGNGFFGTPGTITR